MKYYIFAVFLFVFLYFPNLADFKVVNTIGDENNDNIFYEISSAFISPNKEIYVADRKGNSISKYNWDGEFIKKIGKKGSGPGDIGLITSINYFKSEFYFHDFRNKRILVTDKNLIKLRYKSLRFPKVILSTTIRILKNDHLVGHSLSVENGISKRLVIVSEKGSAKYSFFSKNTNTGLI